jgi:hypothetical protein
MLSPMARPGAVTGISLFFYFTKRNLNVNPPKKIPKIIIIKNIENLRLKSQFCPFIYLSLYTNTVT